MKRARFTEGQIVELLKEADAGLPANEVWRKWHAPRKLSQFEVEFVA